MKLPVVKLDAKKAGEIELLAKGTAYAQMWKLQLEERETEDEAA